MPNRKLGPTWLRAAAMNVVLWDSVGDSWQASEALTACSFHLIWHFDFRKRHVLAVTFFSGTLQFQLGYHSFFFFGEKAETELESHFTVQFAFLLFVVYCFSSGKSAEFITHRQFAGAAFKGSYFPPFLTSWVWMSFPSRVFSWFSALGCVFSSLFIFVWVK